MPEYLLAVALVLLVSLTVGLLRVVLGPSAADRMSSALLMGTTGVAVLMVLAAATQQPSLIDVSLALAVLAPVTTVTFVFGFRAPDKEAGDGDR